MTEQNATTPAGLSRAPIGNGKALVVGLGGCGIRILEFLRANPRAKWLVTLAVDTDGGVLAGTRADAVINVRFGSSAVMQGAAEVIAYGTAVKLK